MHQGKYVFAQIIEFVSQYEFDKCVKRHGGDNRVRSLSCRDQLLALIFGQLTNLRSLVRYRFMPERSFKSAISPWI
ncbi:MAG: DUF4372 domain-containing protein [Parcubacteria group bacterium]|nr:DUF4372 domain-containing protein [Parcubacteria group bacterium]